MQRVTKFLIGVFCLAWWSINAQLSLGDIAFTGYNSDNGGEFSFVLLTDLTAGNNISFTDRGWLAAGGFSSGFGETTITWTAGEDMTCGTQIAIVGLTATNDGGFVNGTVTGTALSLGVIGDQIFAYSGLEPTSGDQSTFVAAMQNSGTGWQADATAALFSAKPTIFTDGDNSFVVATHSDNGRYDCSFLASTDPAILRANVHNDANWNYNNGTPYALPVCAFSCADLRPQITCFNDTTIYVTPGQCSASFTFADPVCTLYCTGVTISRTDVTGLNSGDIFPIDTTTLIWTASGPNGDSVCSFDVVVFDNEDPQVLCPSDTTVYVDNVSCEVLMTGVEPLYSDNCAGATLNQIDATGLSDGDAFPIGDYMLIYEIEDASSNAVFCAYTVSIMDTFAPTIICPNDTSIWSTTTDCSFAVNYTHPITNDNCTLVDTTSSHNPGDIFNVGITTVNYAITDPGGSVATCSFDVTILDTVPPVLICPDTVPVNALGVCQGQVQDFNAGFIIATDPCSAVTITQDITAGILFNVDTTVVVTASDVLMNSSTCSIVLIVNDITDPAFTLCPDTVKVVPLTTCGSDVGDATAEVTYTDNCAINTISQNPVLGTSFTIDTNVVVTVTDVAGNSNTCNIIYSVDPLGAASSLICPDSVELFIDGTCSATVPDLESAVTFTLGCNASSYTYNQDIAIGSALNIDSIANLSFATDQGENLNCAVQLYITDTLTPSVICPNDTTIYTSALSCDANWIANNPVVLNSCFATTITDNINGTGDASGIYSTGIHNVTWTIANTNGFNALCNITLSVDDTLAPIITCPADISVSPQLTCDTNLAIVPPTILENCQLATLVNDYNMTADASDLYSAGNTLVTYTVTDTSGNMAQCSFNVIVSDTNAPVFTNCPNDTLITAQGLGVCGEQFVFGLNATDNCAVAPALTITDMDTTTFNSGDLFPIGEYLFAYEASDGVNTSTCSFVLTVQDTTLPAITCPNVVVHDVPSACQDSISWVDPVISDACFDTLIVSRVDVTGINNNSLVSSGNYTLEFMVADGYGNDSVCQTSFTIADTSAPSIICPNDTAVNVNAWVCGVILDLPDPIVNDSCSVASFARTDALLINEGDTITMGTYTFEYTATDVGGNTASCSFNFDVVDTIGPMIQCQDTLEFYASANTCEAEVVFSDPIILESCATVAFNRTDTTGILSGDTLSNGLYELMYEAMDEHGNTSSCSYYLRVRDSLQITCPGDQTVCSGGIVFTAPTVDFTCVGVADTMELGPQQGDLLVNGNFLKYYEFTDSAGGVATCMFVIQVQDISATFNAGPDILVCDTGRVDLQAIGTGSWSLLQGFLNIVDMNDPNTMVNNIVADTNILLWSGMGSCGPVSDTLMVINLVDTIPPFAGVDSLVCSVPFNLYADTVLAENEIGYWTHSSLIALDDDSAANAQVISATLGVHELVWNIVSPCGIQSDTVYITVDMRPQLLAFEFVEEVLGANVTLDLNVSGATSYEWTPIDGLDNATHANPEATVDSAITYTLIAQSTFGCADTGVYLIDILLEDEVLDTSNIIMNLISPNSDGLNDVWDLSNLTNNYDVKVQVINRWGLEVYSSDLYDNTWSGTFNGAVLPDGTYFYLIEYNGIKSKGPISIIRGK